MIPTDRLNATECHFKKIHLPWLSPQWSKILSCPLPQFQDYKIPPEDSLILSSLKKYLIKISLQKLTAIVGSYVRDALLGYLVTI